VINSLPDEASPVSADDFIAVQRLVHRYADAVVHRDVAQWTSCWADDARWELGRGHAVVGKAAIVELWTGAMSGFASVVQVVHNGDVSTTAEPDRAVGRWYVDERFQLADGQTGMLLAHYDDEYLRWPTGWLFASRRLQVHYRGAADLSGVFTNEATDERY
jgi:ketosteroid isomerase-like protein